MPKLRTLFIGLASFVLALRAGATQVDVLVATRDSQGDHPCVVIEEVTYEPGQGSHSHSHDATVFAYVLRGSVESQVDEEPLATYRPGERWMEQPGARHRISRNASASEPATFLAIVVAHRGSEEDKACAEH